VERRYHPVVRIECEQCHELVVPSWSVDGDQLVARCPGCQGSSRATLTGGARASTRPDGPACPKCGFTPVSGDACRRCGLAAARMATWVDEAEAPEELATAWAACLEAWDDPVRHDRAASLAVALAAQPWLARRYRRVLDERPDDAVAAARLARAGRIAQAAVLATAAAPVAPTFRKGSAYAVLLVLALAAVGGLLWMAFLLRQGETRPEAPRIPATPAAHKRAGPGTKPTAAPRLSDPRVETSSPRR
jgi:hypothetical protein